MAEEVCFEENTIMAAVDEIMNVEVGDGTADCGATRSVIGEVTWHDWLERLRALGREDTVTYQNVDRTFRYCNGQLLASKY